MNKLEKGDVFCTMWTDTLEGPFVYDGESNIIHNVAILTDETTLKQAIVAIELMKSIHTCKDTGSGTLDIPFKQLFDNDEIERAINEQPMNACTLCELQKMAPRI